MAEMEEGRPLLSNEGAARLLSEPEANADGTTKDDSPKRWSALDLEPAEHVGALVERLIGSIERPAYLGGRVVDLVANALEHGDGRDRAGLADLHADVEELGRGFVFFEFIGDRPAWALAGAAQALALREIVDFEHEPIDLEIQFVQPLVDELAKFISSVQGQTAWRQRRLINDF